MNASYDELGHAKAIWTCTSSLLGKLSSGFLVYIEWSASPLFWTSKHKKNSHQTLIMGYPFTKLIRSGRASCVCLSGNLFIYLRSAIIIAAILSWCYVGTLNCISKSQLSPLLMPNKKLNHCTENIFHSSFVCYWKWPGWHCYYGNYKL